MKKFEKDIHSTSINIEPEIQKIYDIFLQKTELGQNKLYEKVIAEFQGKDFQEVKESHVKMEGEVLFVALNLSLLNLVAWKDNIIDKDELSQAKLAFSLHKVCFPRNNYYDTEEMNTHLRSFLNFLLCDFDLQYIKEILYFLYKNDMAIERDEMEAQLEIMAQIDGEEDEREIYIIEDILDCFYGHVLSVDEFIIKVKEGTDFEKLKNSARIIPELKPFCS